MKIEKKVVAPYFQAILDGKKTFEIRLANFDCHEGDILVLREYDPGKNEYTGRVVEKTITYIVKTKDLTFWSEEDIEEYGYQVISLA